MLRGKKEIEEKRGGGREIGRIGVVENNSISKKWKKIIVKDKINIVVVGKEDKGNINSR